jgi:hypothetical protein
VFSTGVLTALSLVQKLHLVNVDFKPFALGSTQFSQGAGQDPLLRQVCYLADAVTVELPVFRFLLFVSLLHKRCSKCFLVLFLDVVEEFAHLGLRKLSL